MNAEAAGAGDFFRSICLVVNYSHPHYESSRFLYKLYGVFPKIVFYTDSKQPAPGIGFHQIDQERGYFSYRSMIDAIRRNPGCEGYLFLMDDAILNYWRLLRFDKKAVWCGPLSDTWMASFESDEVKEDPVFPFWKHSSGLLAYREAWKELPETLRENLRRVTGKKMPVIRGASDCYYVPAHLAERFVEIAEIMSRHQVFLEIAVPCVLRGITDEIENLNFYYIYNNKRTGPFSAWRFLYRKHYDGFHPVKLSDRKNMRAIEWLFSHPHADGSALSSRLRWNGFEHLLETFRPLVFSSLFYRHLFHRLRFGRRFRTQGRSGGPVEILKDKRYW